MLVDNPKNLESVLALGIWSPNDLHFILSYNLAGTGFRFVFNYTDEEWYWIDDRDPYIRVKARDTIELHHRDIIQNLLIEVQRLEDKIEFSCKCLELPENKDV